MQVADNPKIGNIQAIQYTIRLSPPNRFWGVWVFKKKANIFLSIRMVWKVTKNLLFL